MHRVGKSCYFFQAILILDEMQWLVWGCVGFFFLFPLFLIAILCNTPVARTSFIQRIHIEIPSVCISVCFWRAEYALLLVPVHTQILYVGSCLCPGVHQNTGSNPVRATAVPLTSVMLSRGMNLHFVCCWKSQPAQCSCMFYIWLQWSQDFMWWSNWFVVWESTCTFSLSPGFGEKYS